MLVRPTILCVDDDRTVLVALREQLSRPLEDQAQIEIAESAQEALAILESVLAEGGVVPVLITDQRMPGLPGDELIARVRARSPDTLSVMLSGQASAEAVGRALNRGGLWRFLTKPWSGVDLIITVREALRTHAARRALELERTTLSEVHAAALELTATLASTDRHGRLLGRLSRIFGATCAALLRQRDRSWDVVGRVPALPLTSPTPPPKAVEAWSRAAESPTPVRGAPDAGHGWLFEGAPLGATVTVPLSIGGRSIGLLTFGAEDPNACAGLDDERLGAAGPLAAAALHSAELVEALEESNERRRKATQELLRQANTLHAALLAGESSAARRLRAAITAAARLAPRSRVLIHGPAGGAREAVARAIHAESDRADKVLLPVSCAMCKGTAELVAQLELARGGTIYLDGIEYLSDRALGTLMDLHARGRSDVRVLASTTTAASAARESLPSRNRWPTDHDLHIPPLRDRIEDLPTMAELLLRLTANRFGRTDLRFSESSIDRLLQYGWPGDVQELAAVIERAVLTSRSPVVDVAEALLETGQTLGSYTLVERLGAGGMGEVWRARHKHLLRPAAVKLIQTQGTVLSAEILARFRREAQATARLRSPHTVELYDFGVTEESGFFYVMELLDGMDLDALVREHGPIDPARAAFLLGQCLRSLTEAHEAGLIHRDIKPANIFVCRLGASFDFVKLLDFGLVKGLDDHDSLVTRQGAIAGTPMFMSPEHGSGLALDGRSDLYSLGAVAYWMVTGTRLFKVSNPAAVIIAHLSKIPERPSERLGRALPEGLDEWILALLEKEPANRPANAKVALDRLEALGLTPQWTAHDAEAWWERVAPPDPEDPSQIEITRPARPEH